MIYLMRFFTKNKYSAREKELKYWMYTGIEKGSRFYENYLKKFGIEKNTYMHQAVCDFGCGPFGGIFSVLNTWEKYPIDILADDYNKWNYSSTIIGKFNGRCTNMPSGRIDVVFCCNTIDHTRYPKFIINEIHRLLKNNGILYFHVHLRDHCNPTELHPIHWNFPLFHHMFEKKFRIIWYTIENKDTVNNENIITLYSKLEKI